VRASRDEAIKKLDEALSSPDRRLGWAGFKAYLPRCVDIIPPSKRGLVARGVRMRMNAPIVPKRLGKGMKNGGEASIPYFRHVR
jgi:hypothetical protein